MRSRQVYDANDRKLFGILYACLYAYYDGNKVEIRQVTGITESRQDVIENINLLRTQVNRLWDEYNRIKKEIEEQQ